MSTEKWKTMFGTEPILGTPSLGVVGGDNGSQTKETPKAFMDSLGQALASRSYFVSYTWESKETEGVNLFDNTIVSSNHPIRSMEDINSIQDLLQSIHGCRPVVLWWKEV